MANITGQVIDSQTGCPIAGMVVMLRCFSHRTDSNENMFRGCTTPNGQVNHWSPVGKDEEYILQHFFQKVIGSQESRWQMCFDSVSYFGRANTFWPVIDINIQVARMERHHVSLLLGPDDYRSLLTLGSVDEAQSTLPRELSSWAVQRLRKHFSPEQLRTLMKYYAEGRYPGPSRYDQIARELGVDRKRVMRWFSTRRYNLRQNQETFTYGESPAMAMDNPAPFPVAVQAGAISSAHGNGIELSLTRELTQSEMMPPGNEISLPPTPEPTQIEIRPYGDKIELQRVPAAEPTGGNFTETREQKRTFTECHEQSLELQIPDGKNGSKISTRKFNKTKTLRRSLRQMAIAKTREGRPRRA